MFSLHVLAIPHTSTSEMHSGCAYTQKVFKFLKMFNDKKDFEVHHYGNSSSDKFTNIIHHDIITDEEIIECTGKYNWENQYYRHNINDKTHLMFNERAWKCVKDNLNKDKINFLLCFWGKGHQIAADKLSSEVFVIEPGIGYDNFFAPFCVFESYAWMSYLYGSQNQRPRWYDKVIPNYFDDKDFIQSTNKDDYFLFLGRLCEDKGLHIAIQACRFLNKKLVVAGQGSIDWLSKEDQKYIEFIGFVGKEQKAEILSKAKATIMPSLYLEPFGGVMAESFLSGTPVIAPDWGSFSENNLNSVTGFNFKTFKELIRSIENIDMIDNKKCIDYATSKFTLPVVSKSYENYFNELSLLTSKNGWYSL